MNTNKPIRHEDGSYTLHGYTITKKHNNMWRISHEATDFDGSVKTLKLAVAYVNKNVAKPLLIETDIAIPQAKRNGKLTPEAVRYIRSETAQFFGANPIVGKVAAYKRLAQSLGLGVETVARVARRDSYADVQ